MRIRHLLPALLFLGLLIVGGKALSQLFTPVQLNIAQAPLFTKSALPPLNMLVMGKDHKIYFSAYNDTSDLDGDGVLDVGYRGYLPKRANQTTTSAYAIDYYGYFNSYVCYSWDGDKFVPVSHTDDKTCGGNVYWSGDFLNYLTTSRMDALRKVLYGGYRKTDEPGSTILEGAFFPQDGHSWGKEYQSIARDGYDIRKYAPVSLPSSGNYNLFAVTTTQDFASSGYNGPLFRVLQNTPTRVYNWLSIEAPVAGNKCFNSSNQRVDCTSGTMLAFPGHPANKAAFDTLENNYAISDYRYGTSTGNQVIDCLSNGCNPYSSATTNYMAVFTGQIYVATSGTYQFSVDGDDAVDFQITTTNGGAVGTTGYYGAHGVCNCNTYATADLVSLSGYYNFKFRMEQEGGDDKYVLRYRRKTTGNNYTSWASVRTYASGLDLGFGTQGSRVVSSTYNLRPTVGAATRTDYRVRVQVCTDDASVRDDTCKVYPGGKYKPTGILHDYGESDRMYFGLITGSQPNNIEGGVLRRNITSFSSEINPDTGQFRTNVDGIARTISKLRMIGGAYGNNVTNNYTSDTAFNWGNGTGNCAGSANPISNGNCRMWGNPIAEMLYESMRYFAGAGAATPRFINSSSTNGTNEETAMGLSTEVWQDPYRTNGGYPFCAKPFQTIISDINPSYDGDLPGSGFADAVTSKGFTPSKIDGFSASAEGQTIWNQQFGGGQNVFIGEANGVTDGAPTPKTATSFGNIRGLSPEEPTKNGTYYAASVARYAHVNDVSAAQNDQKVSTYAIALASPLPKFQFGNITILPFGKTVSGTFGGDTRKPTNTIVALYIEQVENLNGITNSDVNGGRPYAAFRISYEDVEQGNDFDMDAIVRYVATQNANGTVTINLTSEYAAGSANQNLGYIISGTTKDGVYLEVRDSDSAQSTSVYSLNTPAGVDAGGCAVAGAINSAPCNTGLTLSASRTFTPSDTSAAVQLNDPLWYAAKFGGFNDTNGDGVPQAAEWDADGDGTPDNYFLVTNPLYLRPQLEKAFDAIQNQNGSSGSLAISGAQVSSGSFAVLPSYSSANNGVDWIGDLSAYPLTSTGLLGAKSWSVAALLPATPTGIDARKIFTATQPVTASNRSAAVTEFRAENLGSTRAEVLSQLGYSSEGVFNVDFGSSMTAESIINYLRGDRTLQGNTVNVAPYRARSSILGDIINSAPVISSNRSNFGWSGANGLTADQRTAYTSYVNNKASKREYVFVGANDGMLHAFNDAGVESFAYIPNSLLGRDRLTGLGYLANRSYAHRYYVDGKLTVADALLPSTGNWGTVLVGGLGAGQKGVFGLNVTSPDTFNTNSVLWEINDRNGTPDADIGLVMGQPIVVPLDNGRWVALFGNGYNSINGDPVLYVVDVETGEILSRIKPTWRVGDLLNATSMNGLGNLAVADTNSDGLVDTVYGGDLQGNVWKFDLSGATSASWGLAYNGNPLFTAKDPDGKRQPVTGGFELSVGPNGGYMVYFGTGRYFATGDNTTTDLQSVYGIWDNGTTVTGRGVLTKQQILSSDATTPPTRSISTNAVNYLNQRGWYMDLALTGTNNQYILTGERMIGNPRIQSGKIYFPTYIPGVGTDCVPGGTNWLYGLNPLSGAAALGQVAVQPDNTPVGSGSTGGVSSGSGAPSQGVGITQPSPTLPSYCDPADTECNPVTPTNACSEVVIDPINPTQSLTIQRLCGRQSWRQLR